MTICPCCGSGFEGSMSDGCAACGARAVGPPLPRPERELPSYGRALFAAASAALLLLVFAGVTVSTLLQRETFSLAPALLLSAAAEAAWRVRWTLLPAAAFAAWLSFRLLAGMRREPNRFVGISLTRTGASASLLFALGLALLVAVNLPEHLRRRELARRAGENAVLYATDHALHEYRVRFGSYPSAPSDLRRLPRADCSIEEVIARMEAGSYSPRAEFASLAGGRARGRGRARVVRARVSRDADDVPAAGLPLTNYELALPGRDGVTGTDDDLRMRDGLILDSSTTRVQTTPTPPKKI